MKLKKTKHKLPALTGYWDHGRLNCNECPRGQFEDNVSYYKRLARFYTSQRGIAYRNQCVAKAYDEGRSIKEIAEDYGLSEVATRLILRKTPCSYKVRPSVPEGRDAEIIKRHKEGESFASIARDYGITACRVRDICNSHAFKLRLKAIWGKRYEEYNAETE